MNDPYVPTQVPAQAVKVGTINAIDRSRQYTRADAGELLRSLNEAWAKIRTLESARAQDGKIIDALHTRLGSKWKGILVTALISAGTAVLFEMGMLTAPMLLRYLGLN